MILDNKKTIVRVITIVFLVCLDRFFKSIVIKGYFNESKGIISDIFKLHFSKNYNIAFSIPLSGEWLNILIFIIIIGLVYYLVYEIYKNKNFQLSLYLLLIILGAFSNLYDRIKLGYVIDYFDLKYFTVFNIADMMIVGGVLGLFWMLVIKNKKIA